jgi:hypothetical protein
MSKRFKTLCSFKVDLTRVVLMISTISFIIRHDKESAVIIVVGLIAVNFKLWIDSKNAIVKDSFESRFIALTNEVNKLNSIITLRR